MRGVAATSPFAHLLFDFSGSRAGWTTSTAGATFATGGGADTTVADGKADAADTTVAVTWATPPPVVDCKAKTVVTLSE